MDEEKEYYRSLPPVDFDLADAVKTDIVYKLFRHPEEDVPRLVTEENVNEEIVDKTTPMVLIMHGWTTDDTSPWYEPLKKEYFKLRPHNIVYINWWKAGNKSYDISSANTKPVGRYIAEFILATGVPHENIHLIGHSLGSHLSSFVGKFVYQLSGKKLGRITALDPAGPKFENSHLGPDLRLSHHDAEFVDVIHTDIQLYGYTAPIGHVDFYPNGGKHQVGCPLKREGENERNCSHARSTLYFVESVSTPCKAKEAHYQEQDYDVQIKPKENGREVVFGHHVDRTVRGVFHFETNAEFPFLK